MTAPENSLDRARSALLAPGGLDLADLERTLDALMRPGIDAADLYFQDMRAESWVLEDGIIRTGNHHVERGVGLRAQSGEKTGFAYSDEIVAPALIDAASNARAIVRQGQQGGVQAWSARSVAPLYVGASPLDSLPVEDKLSLLRRCDAAARSADPRVSQVIASLSGTYEIILIAASDGTLAADVRPLCRLNVSVVVESGGKREQGSSGGGGRHGYEVFLESGSPEDYARESVRVALVKLEAVAAPAGTQTVVLGPGWPGVLLHEAVGHGLEGDFNRKGSSAYSGKIGQKVASELCTVVDEGSIPGRRGSLSVDDEGTPTQRNVLIEKGILRGYIQDKTNARLMGMAATGNGRRESYAHLPMPRMTNTYLTAGESDPADIIASVEKGIYAVGFNGGQVDITSGNFVFAASEAYLIENGKVTRPVKGVTLIGNGPDALGRVSMVGNDLALDPGIGVCGKDGQSVPVGVGQPTLKIDAMTVGGTQT
ncbi:metalloprotease TldD [Algiphilus sp. W345]|uniref:Metalloprotease TldD n=1 Tax=Banduia mediterranea TaxID=3075609 RepID=A0ABU2WHF5_9GAMM|nr:metalloprotease TldD [Algiphilus sp. W345]MDT0496963.1 metalloprotease TldD [Algiphilus sp. W345]